MCSDLTPDPVQLLKRVRPMLDPEGTFVLPTMMADSRFESIGCWLRAKSSLLLHSRFPFDRAAAPGFRVVEWLLPSRLRCVEAQPRLRPQAVVGFSTTERLADHGTVVARPRGAAD
jgi:hypothetical protein